VHDTLSETACINCFTKRALLVIVCMIFYLPLVTMQSWQRVDRFVLPLSGFLAVSAQSVYSRQRWIGRRIQSMQLKLWKSTNILLVYVGFYDICFSCWIYRDVTEQNEGTGRHLQQHRNVFLGFCSNWVFTAFSWRHFDRDTITLICKLDRQLLKRAIKNKVLAQVF